MTHAVFLSGEGEAALSDLSKAFFQEARTLMPAEALDQPEAAILVTQTAFCLQGLIATAIAAEGSSTITVMKGLGQGIGTVLAVISDPVHRAKVAQIILIAADGTIDANSRIHQSEGNA